MMLLRFFFFLPVWFFGTLILPWFLVPIAVMFFMDMKTGRLKRPFRWLETHDDLGFGALDQEPVVHEFAKKYGPRLGMLRWLLRNKAYTLRDRLGVDCENATDIKLLREIGSAEYGRVGPTFHYVRVRIDGRQYFELQPSFGFYFLRLYLRIGWKVTGMRHEKPRGGSNGMFTGITPRVDDFDD